MAFAATAGWTVRVFDDFVDLARPRWRQARHVTWYVNGVKSSELHWTTIELNDALPDTRFAVPAK